MLQGTALISLLLLAACNTEQLPNQRMFAQSIASGNTLVMVGKGQEYKVALCGIQVSADREAQAKKLLQSLLTQQAEEKGVSISISRSKGSELRAEVFVPTANPDEEKSLNAELLATGLARATSEDCPNRATFQALEQEARERRVGIWNRHSR